MEAARDRPHATSPAMSPQGEAKPVGARRSWFGVMKTWCGRAIAAMTGSPRATISGGLLPTDLDGVAVRLRRLHADIEHLSPEEFVRYCARCEPLLFDVRDAVEFAVSHLAGARRIDPATSAPAFLANHASEVRGRAVVFYCSVGVRSSRLASRIQADLRERGAEGVYNLEGGLFRWHNEGRALIDAEGATDRIHPYNASWGRFISRRACITLTSR